MNFNLKKKELHRQIIQFYAILGKIPYTDIGINFSPIAQIVTY